MIDNICPICGKPTLDDEPIYTIPDKDNRIRHYDCWEREASPRAVYRALDKVETTLKKMEKLIEKIK